MHKQEYRGGPIALATPQRVESTPSVQAAVSAAIQVARGWRRLALEPRDGGVPAPILKSRTRHACRCSKKRRGCVATTRLTSQARSLLTKTESSASLDRLGASRT